MNKEIKFRVYNTKSKSWVYRPKYEVHLFGETILLGVFMRNVTILNLNDCVALQYTGLLDLKENEIYEGDIIRGKFDFGPAGFQYHVSSVKWHNQVGYQWNFWDLSTIEIIGNIYDNPELLKQ